MSTVIKRLVRYLLYSSYFLICVFLFGLFNLPYEEAEDVLARHARASLNAELEIGQSSLSPTGTFSVDRATLTFSPTIAEAEAIARAEAALTAWETASEAAKSQASEPTTENPETGKAAPSSLKKAATSDKFNGDDVESEDGDNEDEAEDTELKPKRTQKKKRRKKAVLGPKPKVPSPPLPIRFNNLSVSMAPLALLDDLKDNQLFNDENEIILETQVNDAPLRIRTSRESESLSFSLSLTDFDTEIFTLIQRYTGFPVAGLLNLDINLTVPVDDGQYNLVETEGNISLVLKQEGLIGPASIKSKMGEVTLPTISFENLELDFRVAKRRLSIEEFRITGKDLELCGTGHISLTRARPRPSRASRRKNNNKKIAVQKKPVVPSQTVSGQLMNMMGTSRSNLFVRFKFSDRYLGLKENSLLRLVLGDRALSRGKDKDGFIGHKTTARLNNLAKPLSWVASATTPHRNTPNQCGSRAVPKGKRGKTQATKKTKPSSTKRARQPRRGRSAKPFKASKSASARKNPFAAQPTTDPALLGRKSESENTNQDDTEEEEDDDGEAQDGEAESNEGEASTSADDDDSDSDESE